MLASEAVAADGRRRAATRAAQQVAANEAARALRWEAERVAAEEEAQRQEEERAALTRLATNTVAEQSSRAKKRQEPAKAFEQQKQQTKLGYRAWRRAQAAQRRDSHSYGDWAAERDAYLEVQRQAAMDAEDASSSYRPDLSASFAAQIDAAVQAAQVEEARKLRRKQEEARLHQRAGLQTKRPSRSNGRTCTGNPGRAASTTRQNRQRLAAAGHRSPRLRTKSSASPGTVSRQLLAQAQVSSAIQIRF